MEKKSLALLKLLLQKRCQKLGFFPTPNKLSGSWNIFFRTAKFQEIDEQTPFDLIFLDPQEVKDFHVLLLQEAAKVKEGVI